LLAVYSFDVVLTYEQASAMMELSPAPVGFWREVSMPAQRRHVGANVKHLLHLPNREDVAVEDMLRMVPQVCPQWYDAIGLDVGFHWALVRPILRTPVPQKPYAEIDAILGSMAALADSSGTMKVIWPPPTDYLVAIEAKCPPLVWDDAEPWASAVAPKSNLEQQLKRDIALGFSRVAALHVIATPSAETFGDAMHAASRLGDHFLPEAKRQVGDALDCLPVGHCIISVGEVAWKPWSQAGSLSLIRLRGAPDIGVVSSFVREQVDSILAKTTKPRYWRAVYVPDRKDSWVQLDDLFAPPCDRF
jgi:hypothetical protein